MTFRMVLSVASAFLLTSMTLFLQGAQWYVDVAVPGSGNGQSPDAAFKTIQEGIEAAGEGDTVIVAEGIYVEKVQFKGKNIVLQTRDPADRTILENTIIDGNKGGSVVTFAGTEAESCVLSGFTIQNGEADTGAGICGGTVEQHTLATIENNVIADNAAQFGGGGLAYCDGMIRGNVITGNSGGFVGGGGLSECDGDILNNVIAGNSGGLSGGGLYGCDGIIQNNTVVDNTGGGLASAGGLESCQGTIRNCIIWGNHGDSQVSHCSVPTYSCVQDWTEGGEGNMDYFPYFVDMDRGDCHLKSYSPCIDSGNPASPYAEEPPPNGGRINMGAHGNTTEATPKSPDTDGDGLPDDWEMEFFGELSQDADDDADGDLLSNVEEYHLGSNPADVHWYVDNSAATSGDGKSWATAFKRIQEGVEAARDGHTVTVAQGDYHEDVYFMGKNITLTSTDSLDPLVVNNTRIVGDQIGPVVNFSGTEDPTCVLSGFTITNGKMDRGGGIAGGYTQAKIENNVITANLADYGGGLAYCGGTIRNNVITRNTAAYLGGGLYACHGTIQNNQITENTADVNGGGLGLCHGIIQDSIISGNSANLAGGLMYCDGTIERNLISGNDGGGLHNCSGRIRNNKIIGNSSWLAGGFALCDAEIINNTIVRNRGYEAGAFHTCNATIRNCILWDNGTPQFEDSTAPTYSCIEDWSGGGDGNINADPRFLDPSGPDDDLDTYEDNDYRLSPASPCIDVGLNEDWMWSGVDMSGNPRIFHGDQSQTVDMGAYEYRSWPFRIVGFAKKPGSQLEVTWNSRPGDTYTVISCFNLGAEQWIEEDTVQSAGDQTNWIDSSTGSAVKFYRIRVD